MQDQLTAHISTDLGIADLSRAEQETLIAQFGEVALKAATLAVVGKLTGKKRDKFAKLAEAGDPVALKTFLNQEVPNHEKIAKAAVSEEVQRFKDFQSAGAGAAKPA